MYRSKDVEKAMALKHPSLSEWGDLPYSWADLMFTESEAVVGTMLELMDDIAP